MNRKSRIPAIVLLIIGIVFITMVSLIYNFKKINSLRKATNNDQAGISVSDGLSSYKPKGKVAEENNTIIPSSDIKTNSILLVKLINYNWDRVKAQLMTGYEKDNDGNYIYSEGYTLYCNNTTVKNVIFDMNYKDEVIGNVKVGDSSEIIKEKLGVPTFEDKELGILGYKTKEVYAFFYEDQICVYPNKDMNNLEFEALLVKYYIGQLDGGQVSFLIQIRNQFSDFTIEEEGADILVSSASRKIEIIINDGKVKKIILYNGYKKAGNINEYLNNEDIEISVKDLAEKIEIERIK